MVKATLLEPALRHYYVKFAKRQVGPIKRQSSQYWLLIGHALNQSTSTALQSRVLIHVGPLLRWDGIIIGPDPSGWMFVQVLRFQSTHPQMRMNAKNRPKPVSNL